MNARNAVEWEARLQRNESARLSPMGIAWEYWISARLIAVKPVQEAMSKTRSNVPLLVSSKPRLNEPLLAQAPGPRSEIARVCSHSSTPTGP